MVDFIFPEYSRSGLTVDGLFIPRGKVYLQIFTADPQTVPVSPRGGYKRVRLSRTSDGWIAKLSRREQRRAKVKAGLAKKRERMRKRKLQRGGET